MHNRLPTTLRFTSALYKYLFTCQLDVATRKKIWCIFFFDNGRWNRCLHLVCGRAFVVCITPPGLRQACAGIEKQYLFFFPSNPELLFARARTAFASTRSSSSRSLNYVQPRPPPPPPITHTHTHTHTHTPNKNLETKERLSVRLFFFCVFLPHFGKLPCTLASSDPYYAFLHSQSGRRRRRRRGY